jgi:hypothetical protein
MAIVTRRYYLVGPTVENLIRYVAPSAVIPATFATPTIDVQIDDAVAGTTATLDEYMAMLGYVFSAAAIGRQTFRYVVTGLEPSLIDLIILFPVARANVNYNVRVSGGGLTNQLTFDCPVAGYALNQFHCKPSGAVTAGDVLLITVEDLT